VETYTRTNSTSHVINDFAREYPDRVPLTRLLIFITMSRIAWEADL